LFFKVGGDARCLGPAQQRPLAQEQLEDDWLLALRHWWQLQAVEHQVVDLVPPHRLDASAPALLEVAQPAEPHGDER